MMFTRAAAVLSKLAVYGFKGALTGSLAAEIHLLSRGHVPERRELKDLDFVVEGFASLPASLSLGFLFNHVHPAAPEGKTLVQLIDPDNRLRVDVFRQFSSTLARAEPGPPRLISIEDLVARTTSMVLGSLRKGNPLDPKHAKTFRRLGGLGEAAKLEEAWRDHRQSHTESFNEAVRFTRDALELRSDLLIRDQLATEPRFCSRCQDSGPFRIARPELILEILGYC